MRWGDLQRSFAAFAVSAVMWLGFAEGFAGELTRIQLRTEAGTTQVELELSVAASARVFTLDGPRRAVIDLRNTRLKVALPQVTEGGAITAVRAGAQANGDLRLVFELAEGANLRSGGAATIPPSSRMQLAVVAAGVAVAVSPARGSAPAVAPAQAVESPQPLRALKSAQAAPRRGSDVIVAIDAGHGGQDPGAIGRAGTREKDVVLDISKQLAERINREPGMRAILTRDGDYFLSLRERIRRARAAGAQLFVSVHADAVLDPNVSGSSVYVLSEKGATDEQARWLADRENAADLAGGIKLDDKDPVIASVLVDLAQSAQIDQSMIAAERVLRALRNVNEVRKPRVQQAGFVVLKSPDIPSMLVETAFISSPADERLLNRPEKRSELAEAIFVGVRQFFMDHPPDGSRFALAREEAGRRVIAAAPESGAAGSSAAAGAL